MLTEENNKVTIKCDKCNKTKIAEKENYNEVFWNDMWVLNGGRKYEHLCYDCLPKKKKDALLFVHSKMS